MEDKDLIEVAESEVKTEEPEEPKDSEKPKKGREKESFWQKNRLFIIALLVCAVFGCISTLLFTDSLARGASAAADAYMAEKDKTAEAVYNDFYEKSYTISEKKHHVSNVISISVGDLREQAKLEVLKVYEVEYEVYGSEPENFWGKISDYFQKLVSGKVVSWLEVPGYGVFTVDMAAAEFIIDNERQYVLVRVPNPTLSQFTIDYANVEILNFEESGMFTSKLGEDLAREQLESAQLTMLQKANCNQSFFQSARAGAETIIRDIVIQLNPDATELTVDVEFFE